MFARALCLAWAAATLAACGADAPPAGAVALSDAFSFEPRLVASDGREIGPEDFEGRPSIVYFGFANCPDVCPTALGRLSAALDELGPETDLAAWFVTVDPERDTPDALAAYLAFDDRITGLSGDPDAVAAVTRGMNVYSARVELADSALGYTMDHSSLFYLIDRSGTPVYALRDAMAPADLAAAVGALLD